MLFAKKILAENFRSVEDAVRAIEKINTDVSDLLNLQKQYQRQVATVTAAGLMLEVKLPSIKTSPSISTKDIDIKVTSMEKLRKNYSVIHDLWNTKTSLEAMESKIRTSFSGKSVDTTKAIAELAKLKKRVDLGLKEAFAFLRDLADKHAPDEFTRFIEAMCSILEKSIAYTKATLYTYLYEVDGDPTFSTYIQLQNVTDEDSNFFPNLFIVASYRTGSTAPGLYLSTLQEFVPPSANLLMKHVKTVKEATGAMHVLLSLDNFNSSIGSLPIQLLLKDRSIKRELFLYQQYIKSIEVQEDQVVFVLKPEITDKNQADTIISQIWKDFNSLVRKTNCKLRMAIKKGPKSFLLTFFFVTQSGAPQADAEDLAFLKDRFNLSEDTLRSVIKTINQGSN